jgi:ankyrin repeat protein
MVSKRKTIKNKNKKFRKTKKSKKNKKTRTRKQKGGEEEQERLNKYFLSLARIGSVKKMKNFLEKEEKKRIEKCLEDKIDFDVNTKHEWNNYSPALIDAAIYGHTDIVKLLLEHYHADVNITNKDNKNALIALIIFNSSIRPEIYDKHVEIIKILLDAGIDVNMEDSNGNNAIKLAEYYERDDIIEVLREHILNQNMQKQKEDQDERLLKWSIMDKNQVPEKVASSIFNEYGGK